ncbi:MAG: hypothetical protein AB7O31_10025 [Burkholderiales bacterium]
MRPIAAVLLCLALAAPVHAQSPTVNAADTTQSVVAAQKGKRISVQLRNGQELSGTVREVTDKLLVLGGLTGREFFDAVIPLDAIQAVIVRTRQ